MKRIIAVALTVAYALTAPGLPCYQALAGMNANTGKGGLPASQTSIPGMPASVKPDTLPASLKISDMPATSAEKLAVPREAPIPGVPQPASQALPEATVEQNQTVGSTSKPVQAPAKQAAANPGEASPDVDSRDDGAHVLRDASVLATKGSQADPFYDAARAAGEVPLLGSPSSDSFLPSRSRNHLQPASARSRAWEYSPEIAIPPRRQFTLGALMKFVFLLGLAMGGLRSYFLYQDWTNKQNAADRMSNDLHFVSSGLENPARNHMSMESSFKSFMLGITDLHAEIRGGQDDPLHALTMNDRNLDILTSLLVRKSRVLSDGELRQSYDEYRLFASIQGVRSMASFNDFKDMADLYKLFLETRQDRLSGSFDPKRPGDLERLYLQYADRSAASDISGRAEHPSIKKIKHEFQPNSELARSAREAARNFRTSIVILIAGIIAWLIHRPILRRLRRLFAKIGAMRRARSSLPKPESKGPPLRWFQFTLRGLLIKTVAPVALALGAWRTYTLALRPADLNLARIMRPQLTALASDISTPPYNFWEFVRDLHYLNATAQGWHNANIPGWMWNATYGKGYYTRADEEAMRFIKNGKSDLSEQRLKELYKDYAGQMEFDIYPAISFEQFHAIANLYKIFLETREDFPNDPAAHRERLQRAYFDYLDKVILPHSPDANALELYKNADAAFGSVRAADKGDTSYLGLTGNKNFYRSAAGVAALALAWVVYLLRGLLRAGWLKIRPLIPRHESRDNKQP